MATTLVQETYEVLSVFTPFPSRGAVEAVGRAGLGKKQLDAQEAVAAEIRKQFPRMNPKANLIALTIVSRLIDAGLYKK